MTSNICIIKTMTINTIKIGLHPCVLEKSNI